MERRRPIVSCVDERCPPTCNQWISPWSEGDAHEFCEHAIGHCTVPETLRVQKIWPGDHQLFFRWELCTCFVWDFNLTTFEISTHHLKEIFADSWLCADSSTWRCQVRCGIELKNLAWSCGETSIWFVTHVLSSGKLRMKQMDGCERLDNFEFACRFNHFAILHLFHLQWVWKPFLCT